VGIGASPVDQKHTSSSTIHHHLPPLQLESRQKTSREAKTIANTQAQQASACLHRQDAACLETHAAPGLLTGDRAPLGTLALTWCSST